MIRALLLTTLLLPLLAHADANCTSSIAKTGWQDFTVQSGGRDRKVPLYVPASAVGRAHLPLVIDLHGSGGNGRQQAANSGLSRQADAHGFLLANPDGGIADPRNPQQGFFWNIPGVPLIGGAATPADAPDDVQFVRDLIGRIGATACIDSHRVYVTGFSGGARMTSLLACELSDRIAAAAPVAGLRAGVPRADDHAKPAPQSCAPRRPVPLITFHGVNDPTNRYLGDGETRWGYGVPTALDRWVQLDGCAATASEERISEHVTRIRYGGCRAGAELILYRTDAPVADGGGHIWPKDASALIWEFFARHPS
jgi:polyhydroxybutyrate depolymerase